MPFTRHGWAPTGNSHKAGNSETPRRRSFRRENHSLGGPETPAALDEGWIDLSTDRSIRPCSVVLHESVVTLCLLRLTKRNARLAGRDKADWRVKAQLIGERKHSWLANGGTDRRRRHRPLTEALMVDGGLTARAGCRGMRVKKGTGTRTTPQNSLSSTKIFILPLKKPLLSNFKAQNCQKKKKKCSKAILLRDSYLK